MKKNKLVSIVCPVHNEEKTIPLFYERIRPILDGLSQRFRFELIFTNNRSTDKTLNILQGLRKKDSRVRVLTLSRNFGYQASVLSGMAHAQGDCLITIDVDCEDPPEMIPRFLEKWEEGFDVVYGRRTNRPESKIIIAMRNLFYKILKFTADTDIILNMAEFSLIGRNVRDSIISNNNTFPFLRSEIAYSGFQICGIQYDRERRIAGDSHYNFWRMTLFAVGGIISSSTFVFRFAVYIVPLIFLTNLTLLLLDLYLGGSFFKVLVILDLFYIIVLISVHGIYQARIYKNGVARPVYIVDWKLSSIELRK